MIKALIIGSQKFTLAEPLTMTPYQGDGYDSLHVLQLDQKTGKFSLNTQLFGITTNYVLLASSPIEIGSFGSCRILYGQQVQDSIYQTFYVTEPQWQEWQTKLKLTKVGGVNSPTIYLYHLLEEVVA